MVEDGDALIDEVIECPGILQEAVVLCPGWIDIPKPFGDRDKRGTGVLGGQGEDREFEFIGLRVEMFYLDKEFYRMDVDKAEIKGIHPVTLTNGKTDAGIRRLHDVACLMKKSPAANRNSREGARR